MVRHNKKRKRADKQIRATVAYTVVVRNVLQSIKVVNTMSATAAADRDVDSCAVTNLSVITSLTALSGLVATYS